MTFFVIGYRQQFVMNQILFLHQLAFLLMYSRIPRVRQQAATDMYGSYTRQINVNVVIKKVSSFFVITSGTYMDRGDRGVVTYDLLV